MPEGGRAKEDYVSQRRCASQASWQDPSRPWGKDALDAQALHVSAQLRDWGLSSSGLLRERERARVRGWRVGEDLEGSRGRMAIQQAWTHERSYEADEEEEERDVCPTLLSSTDTSSLGETSYRAVPVLLLIRTSWCTTRQQQESSHSACRD